MIAKIELVLVSVKACLWKRRFKLLYAERNYKHFLNPKSKNDLILNNFDSYHLPISQEDFVTIIH